MRHSIAILCLAPALWLSSCGIIFGGPKDPKVRLPSAPVISSKNAKYKTIVVRARTQMMEELFLTTEVIYKAANRFALLTYDREARTPLWFMSGGRFLMFNARTNELLYERSGGAISCVLEASAGGALTFLCGYCEKRSKQNLIDLNLQSLFRSLSDCERTVSTLSPGKQLLRITVDDKSVLQTVVQPSEPCPYTSIELLSRGGTWQEFALENIAVNTPVDDRSLAFPSEEVLAQEIAVRILGENHPKRTVETKLDALMSYFIALNPSVLDTPAFSAYRGVDAAELRKNQQVAAEKLRRLVAWPGIARETIGAQQPMRIRAASEKTDHIGN